MRCPACQCNNSRVLESRSAESGHSIRRRRECSKCFRRFTTYERIEFVPLTVVKRDETKEPFDPAKLMRGILLACEKTEVSLAKIEEIVDGIEADLQSSLLKETTSVEIGEMVLRELRDVSDVAYVRFASVHRQFQGLDDFSETLQNLQTYRSLTDAESRMKDSQ